MRTDLWNSMLSADMNTRYWSSLARRYSNRDQYAKIFLAIMSSGVVAGWSIWIQTPNILKLLSSASAILAIILPILNYHKLIVNASDLAGKWTQMQVDYETMWLSIDNTSNELLTKQYKIIRNREVAAKKLELSLPQDKKMIYFCYNEVLKSRGIKR